jgi:hypothetical protein
MHTHTHRHIYIYTRQEPPLLSRQRSRRLRGCPSGGPSFPAGMEPAPPTLQLEKQSQYADVLLQHSPFAAGSTRAPFLPR